MMKKRLLSLALALCLCLTLLPAAVLAEEGGAAPATETKSLMLGTGAISGYDSTDGYDYIYYGTWDNRPVKWRVLDTKTNMANATEGDGLFLLSEALLGTGRWGDVCFQETMHFIETPLDNIWHKGSEPSDGDHTNCQFVHKWQNSDAQKWCSGFYSSHLTPQEQNAILATTKSDKAYSSIYGPSTGLIAADNILNGDKVFFLSAEEAENAAYGFTDNTMLMAYYGNKHEIWLLRSPDEIGTEYSSAVFDSSGVGVYYISCNQASTARPAFNLNPKSVLFTSAAEDGKSGTVGTLCAITDYAGSEWKLTLLDTSRDFAVAEKTATGKAGSTITLNYSGATVYNADTAPNEYLSVILADSTGKLLYYGKAAQPTAATGTVDITIPADLAEGNYTLNMFSEQDNGDYKTDYASAFAAVSLTISNAATDADADNANDLAWLAGILPVYDREPFDDVTTRDWFYDDVHYVNDYELMTGTGYRLFSPDAPVTRGMVMTILARREGIMTDRYSPWYAAGVEWAVANGISDGTNPEAPITREELATMLYRYAQLKGYDLSGTSLTGFSDAGSVSGYAVSAMQWAVGSGLINGAAGVNAGKLLPQSTATRAQLAAILHRFFG